MFAAELLLVSVMLLFGVVSSVRDASLAFKMSSAFAAMESRMLSTLLSLSMLVEIWNLNYAPVDPWGSGESKKKSEVGLRGREGDVNLFS